MVYREPAPEQFRALLALPQDAGPVEMINLLNYRQHAQYAEGAPHTPCSGREAYLRYGAAVQVFLDRAGARVVWHATPQMIFIGPLDLHWDEVLTVRYPSLGAFVGMITDPAYLEIAVHRSAALADSRLIVTRPSA
jgi:hypothetical protein